MSSVRPSDITTLLHRLPLICSEFRNLVVDGRFALPDNRAALVHNAVHQRRENKEALLSGDVKAGNATTIHISD